MARSAAFGLVWLVVIGAIVASCCASLSSNPEARAAVDGLASQAASAPPVMENPVVTPSAHATLKHPEAPEVRECENIIALYFNKKCKRYNMIKEMPDGEMADQVIKQCGMNLVEVTAYRLAGIFDLKRVNELLTARGCIRLLP